MTDAYIIDSVRTPRGIGKVGRGSIAHIHPHHIAATVLKAIVERNKLDTVNIDDVIWSTGSQRGKQGGDIARLAALDAGYDATVSGVTLSRYCGGGITAVALAASQIMSGQEDVVIAGGSEMMSYNNALNQREVAAGIMPLGMHGGNDRLQRRQPQSHQGVAADAVASMEGITRAELDALALESQRRAGEAIREGRFDRSIVPVVDEAGNMVLARDEYPRPSTTMEGLAMLPPAFAQIGSMPLDESGTTFIGIINSRHPDIKVEHVHHAGNSSGVVDGAAALLLTSKEYAEAHGLRPRARVVASANLGGDPTLMLNAPVPAAQKVLKKAGLTKEDIDLWEINEAFAVVAEKFIRDLDLDRAKVNVNGGAIALGHPIGATGAILIGTLLDELERRDLKRGLVTMCAAGGMAPAIIIERV